VRVTVPDLEGLEGLTGLARRDGVDIRPTLLRVLTDLYVQKPVHTIDEQRHYSELVLGLIDSADVPTRAAIAKSLARCPEAPRPIVQRLAREVLEVSEPILLHSPCLTGADLIAIIADLGASYAAVIGRRDPGLATVRFAHQSARADAIADRLDRMPLSSFAASSLGSPAAAFPLAEIDLERFLAATPTKRRAMLIECEISPRTRDKASRPGATSETIARVEAAALERRRHTLINELERALVLTREQAHMVVEDYSGELIVVAAKAMDVPADVLVRILMFINPEIGESVPRVFDLADLYGRVRRDVALRIMTVRNEARDQTRSPVRHQPAYWPERNEGARARATPPARTIGERREGPTPFGRRQRTI
jgi:hypothetical protein